MVVTASREYLEVFMEIHGNIVVLMNLREYLEVFTSTREYSKVATELRGISDALTPHFVATSPCSRAS